MRRVVWKRIMSLAVREHLPQKTTPRALEYRLHRSGALSTRQMGQDIAPGQDIVDLDFRDDELQMATDHAMLQYGGVPHGIRHVYSTSLQLVALPSERAAAVYALFAGTRGTTSEHFNHQAQNPFHLPKYRGGHNLGLITCCVLLIATNPDARHQH